jgi:membrane dipeptidase
MYRTNGFLVDGHADILLRIEEEGLDFYKDRTSLQQSYHHMVEGGVDLQIFALFVEPEHEPPAMLTRVLQYIETFKREIADGKRLGAVYTYQDVLENHAKGIKSGMLSLEGGDCIQGDLRILRSLYDLGVRAMGLTWNNGNCIADGVGEKKDRGLTPFGRSVIREMNRLGMLVDVSHLGERSFWDVLEETRAPVIASHSNAKAVYFHRRNLTDEQIRAIASTGGLVGVTFVPYFIRDGEATINDLLLHVDHMLHTAGEDAVGFGSDFDGIERTMLDLRNGSDYPRFLEVLIKEYGETVTKKLMGENWLRVLKQTLK